MKQRDADAQRSKEYAKEALKILNSCNLACDSIVEVMKRIAKETLTANRTAIETMREEAHAKLDNYIDVMATGVARLREIQGSQDAIRKNISRSIHPENMPFNLRFWADEISDGRLGKVKALVLIVVPEDIGETPTVLMAGKINNLEMMGAMAYSMLVPVAI